MKPSYILSIDLGTTGNRAIVFDKKQRILSRAYKEFPQIFPKPGWVEHDAEKIWQSARRVLVGATRRVAPTQIAAIGITNQRETTILWDRQTGKPVHRAIVWQDRRTSDLCKRLKKKELLVRKITGLVLDPYFSGTKIAWLLKNPAIRRLAQQKRLAFGTPDSWLLWKLTGGKIHATDVTNASRTLLWDLSRKQWSAPMLRMLGIPASILPRVHPSGFVFGTTVKQGPLAAGIPIAGIAGDQQAALFGQGCVKPGQAKNTYGTGCFLLMQTGKKKIISKNGLLTTAVCDEKGRPAYGLEGAVFIAGAAVQWLRDGLKIIKKASETEKMARSVPDSGGVYMVPAFVGLGAPYWNPDARGLICGLTSGTGPAHLVRATLESIAYQSEELVDAMQKDSGIRLKRLQVDGGAVKNNFLLEIQANLLGVPVARPRNVETTAMGAAQLAGLTIRFWSTAQLQRMRQADKTFLPKWSAARRKQAVAGWKKAVSRALL